MAKISRFIFHPLYDSACFAGDGGRLGRVTLLRSQSRLTSSCSYIQGQRSPENRREYFYFIDHQGQLFLHDAKIKNFTSCFKERQFLKFFTSRLKRNDIEPIRFPEFPYISPCGKDFNFVQCDDRPIVFTEFIPPLTPDNQSQEFRLSYNCTGDLLTVDFRPELLAVDAENGRVYYPSPKDDLGLGLIKSTLSIELSKYFVVEEDENKQPISTWITWNGQRIKLKTL